MPMPPLVLNQAETREIDRRAVEEFGMSGLVLMENAGRGVADKLCQWGTQGPVVICCGKGNNGGDGFVVARHLDLRGIDVRVLLWVEPRELTGDAAATFNILEIAGLPIDVFGRRHDADRLTKHLDGAEWIVDALLGTGARGEPRSPLDQVIEQLNAATAPKVAIDLPSGFNCDTGEASAHTVRARHTCTFVALKPGFLVPGAAAYTGEIHVLDIGAPRRLIESMRNQ